MALGALYPAEIIDGNQNVSKGVDIQFTDDANQPAGTGSPLVVPLTGTTPLVKNTDGDTLLDYDGDAAQFDFLVPIALTSGFTSDAGSIRNSGTEVGFFATAPIAQPVVPLTTPSVQDVVDALVALGLVAQHD